jgi:hypothetical protein
MDEICFLYLFVKKLVNSLPLEETFIIKRAYSNFRLCYTCNKYGNTAEIIVSIPYIDSSRRIDICGLCTKKVDLYYLKNRNIYYETAPDYLIDMKKIVKMNLVEIENGENEN